MRNKNVSRIMLCFLFMSFVVSSYAFGATTFEDVNSSVKDIKENLTDSLKTDNANPLKYNLKSCIR